MIKIILLLMIFSLPIYASGELGTGGAPESSSNEMTYQLVCIQESQHDSTQQVNDQNCVLVSVSADS